MTEPVTELEPIPTALRGAPPAPPDAEEPPTRWSGERRVWVRMALLSAILAIVVAVLVHTRDDRSAPTGASAVASTAALPGDPGRTRSMAEVARASVAEQAHVAEENRKAEEAFARLHAPVPAKLTEAPAAVAAAAVAEAAPIGLAPTGESLAAGAPAEPAPSGEPANGARASADEAGTVPVGGEAGSADEAGAAPVGAEAVSVDEVERTDVRALLEGAEADLVAERLTSPAGRNAYEKYRQVLAIDPGNAAAEEGLSRVVDGYLRLVGKAMKKGKPDLARDFLDRAEQVLPGAERIALARRTLDGDVSGAAGTGAAPAN
jgi:hypothetical protein